MSGLSHAILQTKSFHNFTNYMWQDVRSLPRAVSWIRSEMNRPAISFSNDSHDDGAGIRYKKDVAIWIWSFEILSWWKHIDGDPCMFSRLQSDYPTWWRQLWGHWRTLSRTATLTLSDAIMHGNSDVIGRYHARQLGIYCRHSCNCCCCHPTWSWNILANPMHCHIRRQL